MNDHRKRLPGGIGLKLNFQRLRAQKKSRVGGREQPVVRVPRNLNDQVILLQRHIRGTVAELVLADVCRQLRFGERYFFARGKRHKAVETRYQIPRLLNLDEMACVLPHLKRRQGNGGFYRAAVGKHVGDVGIAYQNHRRDANLRETSYGRRRGTNLESSTDGQVLRILRERVVELFTRSRVVTGDQKAVVGPVRGGRLCI